MLYGNYRFTCRFETDAALPAYKGSTLRGAFGNALRRMTCALRRQDCPACILKDRCLYARVFETERIDPADAKGPVSAVPHPFVIEPPPETDTSFKPGDRFECGLLLFGDVIGNLPYFVAAFQQMGKRGLGRRGKSQGAFALEAVFSGKETLYREKSGTLKTVEAARDISLFDFGPGDLRSAGDVLRQIRVRLETPLRFKSDGRLQDSLPFEVLTRLMLRRVSSLMNAYDRGEPPLDYRGLVERASAVRTVSSDLQWFDWRRYSNRQGAAMQLGGLVGEVVYQGPLDEFAPLLGFCAEVHVGKQTSFGLGKIGWKEDGREERCRR